MDEGDVLRSGLEVPNTSNEIEKKIKVTCKSQHLLEQQVHSWYVHRRTGNFCQGGGKLFAQKILASCPNFYETVEKKRGSYDATTQAALAYEGCSTL